MLICDLINKKVVIFGAKENKINAFLKKKLDNIECYFDNLYFNSTVDGLPVIKPDKRVISVECDYIIITTWGHWNEIIKQLVELGYPRDKILIALEDIEEFKSYEWYAFCNNIDLKNPTPQILNLELSGFCNCKCIYCPFHGEVNLKENKKGLMKWETLYKIVDRLKPITSITTVDFTGPGEIFINKEWFEMAEYIAKELAIKSLYIYTNGMLLNEDNIQKIKRLNVSSITLEISIDGTNAEENDLYRKGAEYAVIKRNIKLAEKEFENAKNISIVITNCFPTNIEYIKECKYVVNSKEGKVPTFLEEDFPEIDKVSQKTFFYGNAKTELSLFNKVEVSWPKDNHRCLNLFNRIAFDYQGNLLRCSCGHAGVDPIACIEDNVIDIWHNDITINNARNNFVQNNLEDDFCTGCPGKGIGKYYVLVKR